MGGQADEQRGGGRAREWVDILGQAMMYIELLGKLEVLNPGYL